MADGVDTLYVFSQRPAVRLSESFRTKKNDPDSANVRIVRKIPGIVLLSHSQIYSTIAAGALNNRVREGNVCDSSAMDTGKNNKRKCEKKKEQGVLRWHGP